MVGNEGCHQPVRRQDFNQVAVRIPNPGDVHARHETVHLGCDGEHPPGLVTWTASTSMAGRAAVGFVRLEPRLLEQVARDHSVHHQQHRRHQLGCAASSRRSGMGRDSTQLQHSPLQLRTVPSAKDDSLRCHRVYVSPGCPRSLEPRLRHARCHDCALACHRVVGDAADHAQQPCAAGVHPFPAVLARGVDAPPCAGARACCVSGGRVGGTRPHGLAAGNVSPQRPCYSSPVNRVLMRTEALLTRIAAPFVPTLIVTGLWKNFFACASVRP